MTSKYIETCNNEVSDDELNTALLSKANRIHNHSVSQIDGLQEELNTKLPMSAMGNYYTKSTIDLLLANKVNRQELNLLIARVNAIQNN